MQRCPTKKLCLNAMQGHLARHWSIENLEVQINNGLLYNMKRIFLLCFAIIRNKDKMIPIVINL